MYFDIGDEVTIKDGSYSIAIKENKYITYEACGDNKVSGTILAIDCRLPIGPSCVDGLRAPCEGMPLTMGKGILFNDILLKTAEGFVFTSSKFICMKREKKWVFNFRGVEIPVTTEQKEQLGRAICETSLFFSASLEEK